MKLILGSTSVARYKILKQLGLEFETQSPNFDERSLVYDGDPIVYAKNLAYLKNQSLSKNHNELMITCDTIVFFENKVFNKPLSYEEAFSMLQSLSGQTHEVISGLCCASYDQVFTDHDVTKVTFHQLSDEHIELFLQDPAYLGRSGAYSLTNKGALLIKSIEGSYENVIGLPLNTLSSLLSNWHISLWD